MNGTDDGVGRAMATLKNGIEEQLDRQRPQLARQAAFARRKLEQAGKLRSADKIGLALNLHRIVAEACAAGAKKTDIAADAGMMDGNGKSSRLHEHALASADTSTEARIRRLSQKAPNYLRLAEAAAKAAGSDIDRAVVDLVQGTKLAEGMDMLPDDVDPLYLCALAKAIQGQARRITKECGLDWYFRTIDSHSLSPTRGTWEEDFDAFLWTWCAVPWVELLTEQVACFPATFWPKPPLEEAGLPELRIAVVCRRIGLALAPFGPNKQVRAYFVRRPVLAVLRPPVKPKAGKRLTMMNMINRPIITCLPDQNGHVFHRYGTLKVDRPAAMREVSLCPASDFPGDDHEFIEVTASSILEVLESGLASLTLVDEDLLPNAAVRWTSSPPDSKAALLERALIAGKHNDGSESRLSDVLEAEAIRMADSLRAFVSLRTMDAEEQLARLAEGERI